MMQIEPTYKTEHGTDLDNELPVAGERKGQLGEFGMDTYTLLHLKGIANKDIAV